ncbi:MAG TPA: lasso peptide biosynthesis B2 protein [Pyrinomonadaceae bacterium]
MTPPTLATTQPFSIIATKHRDGSVLLSAANDRIFKLNGVGALTWSVLEQSHVALGLSELVQELCAQFAAINAGGEMQYDVSPEQLRVDTSRFIRNLADNGLVEVVRDASERECYRIKEDVSGTTSTTFAETSASRGAAPLSTSLSSVASVPVTENIRPTKRETLIAFLGLFSFDLLLRFRGFEALIKKVESWPTAAAPPTAAAAATSDTETCRRICAMVNRAQVYYPKKAMCLQHSAVVTCLLRRKGVSAQMVLAAQEFPPKGHAWVEVDGTVVNDFRQVKTRYRQLRRI